MAEYGLYPNLVPPPAYSYPPSAPPSQPFFCQNCHAPITNLPISPPANQPQYGGCHWVRLQPDAAVPSTALHAGVDLDGTHMYVGRTYHDGTYVPAKVLPANNVAYISFNGEEVSKEFYEVLCEVRYEWIQNHGGYIPPGAVEGGRNGDGEPLYIGRATIQGCLTVGKVHPSHNCCYIPFDGKEESFTDYDILVRKT